MQHHISDLDKVCSIFASGSKNGRAAGSRVPSREHIKIFLSGTHRHIALICGMYHHLVDLRKVCSNCTHGAKMA